MLLTPDSTFSDPFPFREPPTPRELFQLGWEHLGHALGHFGAAGRLASRLAWAWTRARAIAGWEIGRERMLDAGARLFEVWVILRAVGLDVATLVRHQMAVAWAAFARSSVGTRTLAYWQRGATWAQPYWVRLERRSRVLLRQSERQGLRIAEAIRAELSLTLGFSPQALALGGSAALPHAGPRPLNRRQAAEQRQRQWLLILVAADVILIAALLQVAGTIDAIVQPRQLPLEALRPLRLPGARTGAQIRDLALPLQLRVEPTLLPTATWEPVLTATPILSSFGVWEPVLPGAPGYFGPGACALDSQYAPVGNGTFVWPTVDHWLSGYDYSWRHPGLDFNAAMESPIYAVDAGQVVYAGWNNYGYGNFLVLDHGNGWFSAYAHLSQFYVTCNEGVSQGQVVAASGTTGNSTGPHLHFELFQTGVGQINPWDVLP